MDPSPEVLHRVTGNLRHSREGSSCSTGEFPILRVQVHHLERQLSIICGGSALCFVLRVLLGTSAVKTVKKNKNVPFLSRFKVSWGILRVLCSFLFLKKRCKKYPRKSGKNRNCYFLFTIVWDVGDKWEDKPSIMQHYAASMPSRMRGQVKDKWETKRKIMRPRYATLWKE